ncbi:MAG TPA: hypothetical protein PLE21_06240 [Giesbergeria sp.]|jgi:hypothetical protein|nr:hypothetical protein [Acidovorax sp.]HQY39081.1 hypothetical protein [Giesbergeria sp.]HRA13204.1 hypothetical protein [Giesbergeria sp.]
MKTLLASALIALVPSLVLAQAAPTAKSAPKSSTKAATESKTKSVAKKASAKSSTKTTVAKVEPPSSRVQLRSATSQVASGLIAARTAVSPEELAIAERVYVGQIGCELGVTVSVIADPVAPGHFHVGGKGFKYHMAPVVTSTGTVRLEDPVGGAVWLQIANKSMLMDQKRGQRLADECMSPEQTVVAEAIKKTPPPSLLDAKTTK